MGSKKLVQGFALSSLFVCLSASALELDKSRSTATLVETGCAYGRGDNAIKSAQADALQRFLLFLKGETSIALSSQDTALVDEHFDQNSRSVLISGIEQGRISADFGPPFIQGDDTCITVRLSPPTSTNVQDTDGVDWDDGTPVHTVIVVGEGLKNKKLGLTARQAAEQDAFKRAISKALGVMIKSGHQQNSLSEMSASANSDDINVQDVVVQSLSMDSQGIITGWNEVDYQQDGKGKVTLTLDVSVEKKRMEDRIAQMIRSMGQPTVYVDAQLPSIKHAFSETLAKMGFDLSDYRSLASIILKVDESATPSSSEVRLGLTATLLDQAGNQYGVWRNDPTLLALPNKKENLDKLAQVHLAVKGNQQAIKATLQEAAKKIAARGGPIRELIFSPQTAGQQGQLTRVLGAISGVSDIKVNTLLDKRVVVQLRSMNNTTVLAQYIGPTLRIYQPNIELSVLNEFQINVD